MYAMDAEKEYLVDDVWMRVYVSGCRLERTTTQDVVLLVGERSVKFLLTCFKLLGSMTRV